VPRCRATEYWKSHHTVSSNPQNPRALTGPWGQSNTVSTEYAKPQATAPKRLDSLAPRVVQLYSVTGCVSCLRPWIAIATLVYRDKKGTPGCPHGRGEALRL
jgi:hypothetical protein